MMEKPTPLPGKARLLAAAVELVSEGGYAGTTVNEVCRRADVRPPALYYHYGNKDGLVGAVVEAVADAWLDELEAALAQSATFEETLEAGLRGWRALIVAAHSPVRLLIRVQLECSGTDASIRNAIERVMRRSRELIAQTIERSVGPVRDVEELAQSAVSLVQGTALRHHLDDDDGALDRRITEIGRTISALVEARRNELQIEEKTP